MATPRKSGAGSKKTKAVKSSMKKKAPKPAARRPAPRVAKPAKAAQRPKPGAKPIKAAKAAPAKAVPVKVAPPKAVKVAPKPPPRLVPVPPKGASHKGVTPWKGTPPPVKGIVPAKGAKGVGKGGKGAVAGKPPGKVKLVPKKPPAEVKPLGVLPPESMAKPKDRPRAFPPKRPPVLPAPKPKAAGKSPLPSKKGEDRLTDEDMKHFEQRLLAERARIMKEMGHLESTVLKVNPRDSAGDLSGYSFHMADAGTDAMEREKAFDIASKEGRLLMEIDAALRRLYNGEYGNCEVTGRPISRARLEALPWARLSLEEQEKREREERASRGTV